MPDPGEPPKRSFEINPTWFVVSICAGTVLGIVLHDLGLWLSVAVVLGITGGNVQSAAGDLFRRRRK
jgi:hypothetical protein